MIVAPDIPKIVLDYLKAHPAMVALTAGRWSTALPASPSYPCGTVNQVSAAYRDDHTAWIDGALLDVNVWAATEADASRVARTARAVLMGIVGYHHTQGVVVDVDDTNGPQSLPDSARTPPTPRFVFSVTVSAHP